jgi:hypothetical protein
VASQPKNADHEQDTSAWPIALSSLKRPPLWVANFLCALAILVGLLLLFLSCIAIVRLGADLVGTDPQRASEAVKSILPIAAAGIGLPLIVWRLIILNQQTQISSDKTQIDRETHYTSIFSKSVEQLGQTREIKESRPSVTGVETTSRTVPNIEVRLGGIHSLARLAEESDRDREKIENTLLSYVRENSWSDRDGTTYKRLSGSAPSSLEWEFNFRKGDVEESVTSELTKWMEENKKFSQSQLDWGVTIPETRVDVNEAIDAVVKVREEISKSRRSRFYECIFVGRAIRASQLASSHFERCSFVRCRFDLPEKAITRFFRSSFVDCVFTGKSTELNFLACQIFGSRVSSLTDSKLEMRSCEAYRLNLYRLENVEIDLPFSTLHDGGISSETEIVIKGQYTAFPDFRLAGITLKHGSSFPDCAFPNTNFRASDLRQGVFTSAIRFATADSKTQNPSEMKRPESWPAFDPQDSSEIPF